MEDQDLKTLPSGHDAFGQSMPNWSGTAAVNDPKKYQFGMNGKEVNEWAKQDFWARIYDGRVGGG